MCSYFNENCESLELDSLNFEVEFCGVIYVNEEDIFVVYIMGSVDINKFYLVVGVCYECIDFFILGMWVEFVENEEIDVEEVVNMLWEVECDYDYWLFSVNVRYIVLDKF